MRRGTEGNKGTQGTSASSFRSAISFSSRHCHRPPFILSSPRAYCGRLNPREGTDTEGVHGGKDWGSWPTPAASADTSLFLAEGLWRIAYRGSLSAMSDWRYAIRELALPHGRNRHLVTR